MQEKFKNTIQNLPQKPGVYRYYSVDNLLLYVGKAKNLKSRVSSYFQEGRPKNQRLTLMLSQIDRIEYTVVETEKESLILEANLIYNLQPKYNVQLKSDRSYVYVRITDDPIPGIYLVRRKYDLNSNYYGPYTKRTGISNTLRTLRLIFPYCQEKLPRGSFCNYYKIGMCDGICGGEENIENYKLKLHQLEQVLKGKTDEVVDYLYDKIKQAVDIGNFELAGLWRDRLNHLTNSISDQKIILPEPMDIDLVTLIVEPEDAEGYQMASAFVQNIRDGKIINVNNFLLSGSGEDRVEFEFSVRFLQTYFAEMQPEADILINIFEHKNDEFNRLMLEGEETKFIGELVGGKITQRNTVRANKSKIGELMEQGKQNAIIYLERNRLGHRLSIFEENNLFKTVTELKDALGLSKIPRRIECYDISHLSGKFVYGSMVVFIDGRPSKSNYRLFKTTERNDDFANHSEVLSRRLERCFKWLDEHNGDNNKNPWKLPDLMIIDGGKGQLSADELIVSEYKQKFEEKGFEFEVELCALAKREEEIFLPNRGSPVILQGDMMFLVQRIRDEAHRFAITNNRNARLRQVQKSELDEIPGVGPKTKQLLLKTFGSVKVVGDTLFQNQELIYELVGKSITDKLKVHFGMMIDEEHESHVGSKNI
jgi:excinuclease ABC subunit C